MRRLLTLVLLLAFGLPGVTPLLALNPGGETSIRACCRRAGAHGCLQHMHDAGDGTQVSVVAPRCPFGPGALPLSHFTPASFGPVTVLLERVDVRTAGIVQTEARGRISEARSHQKRGPPANA